MKMYAPISLARKLLPLAIAALALFGAHAAAQSTGVVVNRVELTRGEVSSLSMRVGQPIVPGQYWYDAISGAWGYQGGPMAGQLPAGLGEVRGALRADASGGMTEVFVNGRAIHPSELQMLVMTYGQVPPGRWSANAQGQIVPEGQPFPPMAAQGSGNGWWGGNSVYAPGRTSSGAAGGLHVGQDSDGCTYVVTEGYSSSSC